MRVPTTVHVVFATAMAAAVAVAAQPRQGILLERLPWTEAKQHLTESAVVVIPLGAQLKEHGPHLRLDNDWQMAEYFKARVVAAANVVMAPTINYNFYPAFVEYAGSTTLRLETARDVIVDICTSLAHHGARRFYMLNTGVSTVRALAPAAQTLAEQGILLHFTDLNRTGAATVKSVARQKEGTHADEIETSMMLYINPSLVDMTRATAEYPTGTGPLTPDKNIPGRYSASGVYGNATLASREKGQAVVEAMVRDMLSEIDALRHAPLPARKQ